MFWSTERRGHEFYVGCKSWTNVLQVTHRHCATYGYGKWKYGTADSCVSSTSPGSHCCSPFWIRCSHSCWASGMDSDISHSALIWRCTQCIKVTLSCWLKRWSSSSCNWLSSCSRSTIQHWFNAAQCLWWYHSGSRTGGTDNILLLGIELYGRHIGQQPWPCGHTARWKPPETTAVALMGQPCENSFLCDWKGHLKEICWGGCSKSRKVCDLIWYSNNIKYIQMPSFKRCWE